MDRRSRVRRLGLATLLALAGVSTTIVVICAIRWGVTLFELRPMQTFGIGLVLVSIVLLVDASIIDT